MFQDSARILAARTPKLGRRFASWLHRSCRTLRFAAPHAFSRPPTGALRTATRLVVKNRSPPLRGSTNIRNPETFGDNHYDMQYGSERIIAARAPKLGGEFLSLLLVFHSWHNGADPQLRKHVFDPETPGPNNYDKHRDSAWIKAVGGGSGDSS